MRAGLPPHALMAVLITFWSRCIHTCVKMRFSCGSIVISDCPKSVVRHCKIKTGFSHLQMNCVYWPLTPCSNIIYTIMCFTVLNISPSLIANDWAFSRIQSFVASWWECCFQMSMSQKWSAKYIFIHVQHSVPITVSFSADRGSRPDSIHFQTLTLTLLSY